MGGQRTKMAPRCPFCRMHPHLCVCGDVVRHDLPTRLVLVMHKRETTKTTNTGHLARLALANSQLLVRGRPDEPLDYAALVTPERRTAVLFPTEDSVELGPAFAAADPRPLTLVVPDGNWRQAARVAGRMRDLADVTYVRLPPGPPSRYRLRQETRDDGLATFEAIARAMGLLEGAHVQASLERVFDLVVERTLWTRGRLGAPTPP